MLNASMYHLNRLQRLQILAAHLVNCILRHDFTAYHLYSLHFLPRKICTSFKVGPYSWGFSAYDIRKGVLDKQFICFLSVYKPKHELFVDKNASSKYKY